MGLSLRNFIELGNELWDQFLNFLGDSNNKFNYLQVSKYWTYISMVGSLNKLPIAVCGMIFFEAAITPASVMGVILAFLAGVLYSYAKSKGSVDSRIELPVKYEKLEADPLKA